MRALLEGKSRTLAALAQLLEFITNTIGTTMAGIAAQKYARVGGVLYLLIILIGAFDQIFIRGSLVVAGDPAATANNLLSSSLLWRIGIVGDITMHVLDIPLMVILYTLLKPVHKTLARLAVTFNVIQTAVLVANKLVLVAAVQLLHSREYAAAFDTAQVHAQVYFLCDLHNYGFATGLIFFGFACLGYGYLVSRSGYIPKPIGVLVILAGCSYLISSFTLLLAPGLAGAVMPILVISLIGESSFCLWLLIKGINLSHWPRTSTT